MKWNSFAMKPHTYKVNIFHILSITLTPAEILVATSKVSTRWMVPER